MEPSPASLLNERQKQCLRLVYQNLEAKEIAQRLGLSPHTVNEHLREARRVLGTGRSMQAARMLAMAEGDNRIVPDPLGVADVPIDPQQSSPPSVSTPTVAIGGNRYNLSVLQRLGLIVAIAVGIVALCGALITATETITRALHASRVDLADGPYQRR